MNSIIYAGKHFLTQCVSLHKHNTWELVYCTGRSGRFIFDHLQIPYAEGDVVVIPPGMPHKNVSENGFTNIHLNIDAVTLPFHEPVLIRDDSNHALLHLFSDAYSLFCGEPERKAALLDAYGSLIVRCMAAYHTARPKNRIAEQIEQSMLAVEGMQRPGGGIAHSHAMQRHVLTIAQEQNPWARRFKMLE